VANNLSREAMVFIAGGKVTVLIPQLCHIVRVSKKLTMPLARSFPSNLTKPNDRVMTN
jgi:hypothetical protein